MSDSLARWQSVSKCPTDAVRWACLLEATAPKAGNVYPGKPFADLRYTDFTIAAEITANHLTGQSKRISGRMLDAVVATRNATGTNVNLGIVLLLGPLVAADQIRAQDSDWRPAIGHVLASLDTTDGQNVFAAITHANPGGLGDVDTNDVNTTTGPVDLVAAMQSSASRDRVARQYATDFDDFLRNVVPVVEQEIQRCGDLLMGVRRAHLRLLAAEPDSLIARKLGDEFAAEVRDQAARTDVDDGAAVERLDAWLRSHRANPGTTADLIAAALYLLLRNER